MTVREQPVCPVHTDFDPLSPAFLADPFAVLDSLPRETPVFYAPSIDYYVVAPKAHARDDDFASVLLVIHDEDPLLPRRRSRQARSGDRARDIDTPLSSPAARRGTGALLPCEHLVPGTASTLGPRDLARSWVSWKRG